MATRSALSTSIGEQFIFCIHNLNSYDECTLRDRKHAEFKLSVKQVIIDFYAAVILLTHL